VNLFDLLSGELNKPTTARQLSNTVGARPEQVQRATELGLPALLEALARNASNADGANSLARALEQHKDDPVDDFQHFFQRADTNDGRKILGHVFGGDQERVQASIAEKSGLDAAKVSEVMTRLAPLLLGALGQQKKQQNLDPSGIASLLSGISGGASQSQAAGLGGLLSGLLGGAQQRPAQQEPSGLNSLFSMLMGGGQQSAGPQASGIGGLLSGLIGAQPEQAQTAAQVSLPTLVEALRRNASTPQGAAALARALEQHANDPVDDLPGFLRRADTDDGNKILNHVFGNQKSAVQNNLAQQTGLDSGQVASLLARLAPLVLGALGQQKRQQNLDSSGVAGLLTSLSGGLQASQPGLSGMMGQLLGGAGAQDAKPDAIGSLLGSLFNKK